MQNIAGKIETFFEIVGTLLHVNELFRRKPSESSKPKGEKSKLFGIGETDETNANKLICAIQGEEARGQVHAILIQMQKRGDTERLSNFIAFADTAFAYKEEGAKILEEAGEYIASLAKKLANDPDEFYEESIDYLDAHFITMGSTEASVKSACDKMKRTYKRHFRQERRRDRLEETRWSMFIIYHNRHELRHVNGFCKVSWWLLKNLFLTLFNILFKPITFLAFGL